MSAVQELTKALWPFAILLIGFVILQASAFLKTALGFNKKYNVLTQDEVKGAFKTGAFSVIGPAFSVVVISLTLIQLVGSAATFMRVGVIGAAAYELNLANQAAEAVGVTLGSPEITTGILTLCLFGMVLGSAPYFLNCFLTLKPMDAAMSKPKEAGKVSFTPILGLAASIGLIGRSATAQFMIIPNGGLHWLKLLPSLGDRVTEEVWNEELFIYEYIKGDNSQQILLYAVATMVVIAAFFIIWRSSVRSGFVALNIKKSGKKGLNDWILAIALVCGMIVGSLVRSMIA